MLDSNPTAGTIIAFSIIPTLTLSFAWCPAGEFLMGSHDSDAEAESFEKPQHRVTLTHGFWMARTVVTQHQWRMLTVKVSARPDPNRLINYSDLPFEPYDWFEAKSFCDLLNRITANNAVFANWLFDLPTEAEWEYAARAGTTTPRFCADDEVGEYCWHRGNTERKHPVALKKPNPWGLHDMYGNVDEWCLGTFYDYKPDHVTDPIALDPSSTFMMTRGSSYHAAPSQCRSSARAACQLYNPYNDPVGFRLVLRHTSINFYANRSR